MSIDIQRQLEYLKKKEAEIAEHGSLLKIPKTREELAIEKLTSQLKNPDLTGVETELILGHIDFLRNNPS